MRKRKPFCSVVVVSYNGKELLERFLPSILNLDYLNFEVIVVDNASNDRSPEIIKTKFPQVKLIQCSKNEGTAEGSNIGARCSKGEYILWLSNDMELDRQFLTRLIELAESSPDIGICTCKMKRILPNGEKLNIIDSVGGTIDVYGFPSARGINQVDHGQLDQPCEVFFSFGGAMLINREVFEKTGGYDPEVFTLGDDIDLCWRSRLLGLKVMAEPKSVLFHRVSATLSGWDRPTRRFLSERNTLRSLLKNYSLGNLVLILPRYLSLLTAEMSIFLILLKPRMMLSYVKALTWNLLHLGDTWSRRLIVQRSRRVSDREIKKLMIKKPLKVMVLKDFMTRRGSNFFRRYLGESP